MAQSEIADMYDGILCDGYVNLNKLLHFAPTFHTVEELHGYFISV